MIYVGTCGYSYKDWIGTFYPATIKQNEMLAYYAGCFSAVEIDSTYYRILPAAAISRIVARTPAEFRLCFKAPAVLTHQRSADLVSIPAEAAEFLQSLGPAIDSNKFGAILLQFPNGYQPNDATRSYVRSLIEALRPVRCVAEFRHREWQSPQTLHLLHEAGAGYCNVDMPAYETLMHPSSDVTAPVGYVRFHGRNAKQWWSGTNVTRYDYEYTCEELEPWIARIAEIDSEAGTTFAFFNNHARGNAARNAEALMGMMAGRLAPGALRRPPREGRSPSQGGLF